MKNYCRGWVGAVRDDGTLKPGIYCADSNANDLINTAQQEYVAHGLPLKPQEFASYRQTTFVIPPARPAF